MDIGALIAPVAANLAVAAGLMWLPGWMRPGIYFGARVAPEYVGTAEARHTRRRYSLRVWAATACAAALGVFGWEAGSGALALAGIAGQFVAAFIAFRSAWRETLPHSIPVPDVRSTPLFAEAPRVPWAFMIGPFAALAAACLVLGARWDAIPARFPIHWDFEGNANGWSSRTPLGVFGPALIGLFVLVFISVLVVVHSRTAARTVPGTAAHRRNRMVVVVEVGAMWLIAAVFSLVALTPLILRDGQFPIPVAAVVGVPILFVAGIVWWAARENARPDEDGTADYTPDDCWKWGQFYYNPQDPAILVEKRFGIGWTFNFAHWQSWALLLFLIAVVPATIFLVRSQ